MKKQLLFLVLMLLPMLASADPVEIDGIYYNLITENKTAEVTSNPNKYSDEVVIPSSVTYNDVEYSVTNIGFEAFRDCSSLTSITIPNSVTSIGVYVFYGCTSLASITIPNSVKSIDEGAFNDCSSLTSITIPNSVTSIGDGAFGGCSSLTSIIVESGNTVYDSRGNCNAIIETTTNKLIAGCKNTIIPNSVTSIGKAAFVGCTSLTSITIPNSVTSIGQFAFSSCTSLTSITIPNSVTSIGGAAFSICSCLTSVTIPNSVTSIGNSAFSRCRNLTSITIPNSVTSIGDGAFEYCSSLTSIIVESGNTVYDSRKNCNAIIETTTNKLIAGCKNTIIPNSVTSIGDYSFRDCTGLTSITIPNSVTCIGRAAFYNCSSLTFITIGSEVNIIGSHAFANCPKLIDVYCYAIQPRMLDTNNHQINDVFDGSYPENATLHVPDESLQAYKETWPWRKFGTIVGLSGGTPETPKCATPTVSYDNDNKKLTFGCETEGVEYVYSITDTDIKQGYDAEVTLTATYEISVYATKAGYENSDVATATLVWGSATFTDTTPATAIEMVPAMEAAMPVLIQNNGSMLTVQGAQDGTPVSVYTIAGTEAGSAVSQNSCATISTSMQQGDIAIIKIGERSIKVVLK